MKKLLVLWLSLMVFVYPLGGHVAAGTESSAGKSGGNVTSLPETDRVIAKLDAGVKAASLKEYDVIDSQIGKQKGLVTLEVPEDQSTKEFINELEKRNDVQYAEPDHLIKLAYTPNDPSYSSQWHHEVIQTDDAWNRTKGSSEVVVAVIDNGIDSSHTDLQNKIVSPYDVVYGTSNYITAGEHGTHVAGIIASSIDNGYGGAGVAPNVSIMPINVFYGEYAYSSDVIDGIYYAVANGADIINMSLGSYNYNYSYNYAIQYANESGVLIVAAAGNDSKYSSHYPSSYPNVVSVSSTTSSDSLSWFSNYGPDIDIAAPGSSIYSTVPYSSYGYMSGTSMASPVVAGVAALVKSSEPNLSNSEIANRLYETADDLGSSGKDWDFGNGRVNAKKALGLKELQKPSVNAVSDKDTTVTGSITDDIGKGTVKVSNQYGLVGSANVSSYSSFSVTITKQSAGTSLSVTVVDQYGSESDPTVVTVKDKTAPAKPIVAEVTDQSDLVTGTAEAYSQIYVKTASGTYTASADYYGYFYVYIPKQKANSIIEVTAWDADGNVSPIAYLTVKDKTAPAAPTVNAITDASKTVTGKTEANATVEVKANGVVIGKGKARQDGGFEVTIPVQKGGTKLSVRAIDSSGNASSAKEITVADKTAPVISTVNQVTDQSKEVSGKTEAGVTVTVAIGSQKYSGKADSAGSFKVTIPVQKAGTKIIVTAADSAGNMSSAKVVTVADKTVPIISAINLVSDQSKEVSGKTEAGVTVTVAIGSQKYSGKADSAGSFKVAIPVQKAGTKMTVTAADTARNMSGAKVVTVLDKTAPVITSINQVSNKSKEVTGKAEAGVTITVSIGSKKYSAKTDSKGTFKVTIPVQTAGSKITVSAKDAAGNVSASKTVVVADKIPPAAPVVNAVSNVSKVITGKTEPKATVTAAIGSKKYTAKSDAKGNFTIKIPAQKAGVKVAVSAKDAAGNISASKTVTVIDKIAPAVPKVTTPVKSTTTVVSGTAEASSTITIKAGKKVIGSGKIDTKGKFKVKIKAQKKNTVLTITATDKAKNVSKPKTVKVQ